MTTAAILAVTIPTREISQAPPLPNPIDGSRRNLPADQPRAADLAPRSPPPRPVFRLGPFVIPLR